MLFCYAMLTLASVSATVTVGYLNSYLLYQASRHIGIVYY